MSQFAGRARTAPIETVEGLGKRIAYLKEYAASIGRNEPLDVNSVPFGSQMNSQAPLDPLAFREQIEALEAVGVTWVSVGVPGESRAENLDSIARFGAEVIG